MNYLSVCKNIVYSNVKKGWKDPEPTIRVSNSPSGKVIGRGFDYAIVDKDGMEVARLVTTTDGTPIIKCGAKVGLITKYPVKKER